MIELLVVVFLACTKVEISLEMLCKAGREGEVEAVSPRADVLVEGIFVV